MFLQSTSQKTVSHFVDDVDEKLHSIDASFVDWLRNQNLLNALCVRRKLIKIAKEIVVADEAITLSEVFGWECLTGIHGQLWIDFTGSSPQQGVIELLLAGCKLVNMRIIQWVPRRLKLFVSPWHSVINLVLYVIVEPGLSLFVALMILAMIDGCVSRSICLCRDSLVFIILLEIWPDFIFMFFGVFGVIGSICPSNSLAWGS